jgi:hypothetical protein
MASIPLSMQQLEDITTAVAQELLERWAINDRFDEEHMTEATENAVEDTIFIINQFMEHFNTQMLAEQEKSNLIV